MLNLGYPWWLLTAVIVVFAARLWFTLGGWERPRIVVPLLSVLAPVCALAAVFVAMALSVAITEPLKPPSPPQDGGTDLRTTPERTRPATTRSAEPASPTVTPSPAATAPATRLLHHPLRRPLRRGHGRRVDLRASGYRFRGFGLRLVQWYAYAKQASQSKGVDVPNRSRQDKAEGGHG